MCGIIGIASRSPIRDQEWLRDGRDAMAHRGPDDADNWWSTDGRVGLGHRRLAIIDLSPAGHQPMQDSTGLTVVLNGEIYNFQEVRRELQDKGHDFHSHSDTEVILSAYREWGTDCVSRFLGMFSFALYDSRRQTLFMARDRAGEKPLFYAVRDGTLCFSSELKGLLKNPTVTRRLDPASLDMFMALGYVPGAGCILEGVHKLPPATALLFDLPTGHQTVWSYWQLPPPPQEETRMEELLGTFEALFADAVRRQLTVSDVPVGVLLSGGVDSSLVTAMAVRASSQVKTFTIGFPGFGSYDESEHARLVARHFDTEHTELNAGGVSPDLLPRLAYQYDEPIIDSSMVPTFLVSQLVRQYCTVALGGDGGDELFGGYKHYDRMLWTQEKIGWAPRPARQLVATGARHLLPTGFRGRTWLQVAGADFGRDYPGSFAFFDALERRRLTKGASGAPVAERMWTARVPFLPDLLQRITRMDFQNYMPEDILVKVDRASMLNSLEVRAPLLDHRVVEFAFGRIPTRFKANSGERKIFLKRLAARLLPPEFDRKRKAGFAIPLGAWLKAGPWRNYLQQILLDSGCFFDRKSVEMLFLGQDRGRNNGERLFGLALFELWRRAYAITS